MRFEREREECKSQGNVSGSENENAMWLDRLV